MRELGFARAARLPKLRRVTGPGVGRRGDLKRNALSKDAAAVPRLLLPSVTFVAAHVVFIGGALLLSMPG
jgi:hypothetical protein